MNISYSPLPSIFAHFVRAAGNRSQVSLCEPATPPRVAFVDMLRPSIPDEQCEGTALVPHFVRAAGNRTRPTRPPALRTTDILRPALENSFGEILCRAAGNRTRSLRTRIARTTAILRPDTGLHIAHAVATNISSPSLRNFAAPARGRASLRDIAPPRPARAYVPKGTPGRRRAPWRGRTHDLS